MALIAAHLNAGIILVVTVESPSPPTSIPPSPPFSPSLISCTVSVDVKHDVYNQFIPCSALTVLSYFLLFRILDSVCQIVC